PLVAISRAWAPTNHSIFSPNPAKSSSAPDSAPGRQRFQSRRVGLAPPRIPLPHSLLNSYNQPSLRTPGGPHMADVSSRVVDNADIDRDKPQPQIQVQERQLTLNDFL